MFSPTTHCHLFRPRFNKHRVFRYLQNCEDVSNVEHGIDLNSGTALGDQTSDIDKKSIDELHGDQEETADQLDGQSSVKPKRPNLLKVLKGTQWSKGLRDGQLQPHFTCVTVIKIRTNFRLTCIFD